MLFVRFNKALVNHLREREHGSGSASRPSTASASSSLTRRGIELPTYPAGEAPQEFFREELPAALMEAADVLVRKPTR